MEKLKPCPFCGGTPSFVLPTDQWQPGIINPRYHYGFVTVGCPNCDLMGFSYLVKTAIHRRRSYDVRRNQMEYAKAR